jgi:hypothetical protein
VSPSPFSAGFVQLENKHVARRLAEIRVGRAHEPRRLTEFPQFSVGHLRQSLAQLFEVDWLLRG